MPGTFLSFNVVHEDYISEDGAIAKLDVSAESFWGWDRKIDFLAQKFLTFWLLLIPPPHWINAVVGLKWTIYDERIFEVESCTLVFS